MPIIDSILMELDQEAATTRRVLERVPQASLAWKPHAKSMSLGQLAMHVASVPGGVAEIVSKNSVEVPQFKQPAAETTAELLTTLDGAIGNAKRILGNMDDAFLQAPWSLKRG